jgi:hypothetical protein
LHRGPGKSAHTGTIGAEKRIRTGLWEIAGNKATGVEELPIELIKAAGEAAITALTTLCGPKSAEKR